MGAIASGLDTDVRVSIVSTGSPGMKRGMTQLSVTAT